MKRQVNLEDTALRDEKSPRVELGDGARIGVIGGGPAGSFFCYFFLDMAERVGRDFHVDVYEPRDFSAVGPVACNMCGGIISETLVQNLAAEGINLPATVVQRGIDSYVLHVDAGSVRIETPLQEMRIGAVHRAGGPRDLKEAKWDSFDGFLQARAVEKGAHLIRKRVEKIHWDEGRPQLKTKDDPPQTYDFLVVAAGVNSTTLKLFQDPTTGYESPQTAKTFMREYHLGEQTLTESLGSSMHVFLLNIPGLDFAAIIPKGDYASLCLLGDKIDRNLLKRFLESPEVRRCMPPGWQPDETGCQCSPRIVVQGAAQPFGRRLVFIGDAGVTRLYKDGIGAAYRTAKAAATTAVFQGISAEDFQRYYWPVCRTIERDNGIGKIVFAVTHRIQRRGFARRAILRMVDGEQRRAGRARRMSMVMWDLFTGSASYRDILGRTLHPGFLARFARDTVGAIVKPGQSSKRTPSS
jgi:flavin-dependent dehydrogenase